MSYQIRRAQMKLSTWYTSIALLELTLALCDNTRYCYMGSLHQVSALEIAKLKFPQTLYLATSPNLSATQYNPIFKAFLAAGNLDISCRYSEVRYYIHNWSKEHKCGSFPATVHTGLLWINSLLLIPYTENYMQAGGPRSEDQSLWCHFRLQITYSACTIYRSYSNDHFVIISFTYGWQKEGRAECFACSQLVLCNDDVGGKSTQCLSAEGSSKKQ